MNREQWEKESNELAKALADRVAEADLITDLEEAELEEQTRLANDTTRTRLVSIGRQIVLSSPSLFVSFDAEMDGGSLLAFGAVTPWGETIKREVKPASDFYNPSQREFCETHGLERDRLMEEGTPLEEAIFDLDVWVRRTAQEHDGKAPVFMAFNASEDWPLISNPMKQMGIKNPFGIAGYCLKSEALALTMLTQKKPDVSQYGCDWKDTGKGSLPKWLVPDREFTHDPLEDAEYQLEIKYALTGYIAAVGVRNCLQLEEEKRIRNQPEPHDDGFFDDPYR